MDADRLITMARNPRNIVGIFNYCDRWCERCLFTDRCLQYQAQCDATEAASDAEAHTQVPDHVSPAFNLAFELIARKMAEFSIRPPSEGELAIPDPDEDAREERVRTHSLMKAAHAYSGLVGAWFDAERTALMTRADQWIARVDRGEADDALVTEAVQVKESLQIIERDRWFITPKLARALHAREWERAYPDLAQDAVQNDSNGSAKVALLSIGRSEAAWRLLAHWMNDSATAMLLAETLAQLRTRVEVEFPAARQFVRPGFDETSL
jgi:hypothetical protein